VSRYAPPPVHYSFGPGGITPAVKYLIIANVIAFLATMAAPVLMVGQFGLTPRLVLEQLRVWQLGTYLFVHDPGGFTHILFNMLALWMFGVDLERRWGTEAFTKYYFVTGVGAGAASVLAALLPFEATRLVYDIPTIGASGAVYGLLFAWALLFPHRRILFMFIFPLPARAAAAIMGAMAFLAAVSGRNSGVAETTHLAGMLAGWIYLKGPADLRLRIRYRLTKWRMERMRRKFGIHKGGRDDWDRWIH
jgi:membrane associated rhomboid family serine protease